MTTEFSKLTTEGGNGLSSGGSSDGSGVGGALLAGTDCFYSGLKGRV